MSEQALPKVDQSAIKVNQAFIISLLLLAFILNEVWLVAFVSAVMLLGTAVPALALFKQIYKRVLKPAGLVKPEVIPDHPEPHRFTQGFGGVVVALSLAAHLAGQPVLGWALAGLVVFLASLNLLLGFCAGCFLYYQLNQLGVPGFDHSPVK